MELAFFVSFPYQFNSPSNIQWLADVFLIPIFSS